MIQINTQISLRWVGVAFLCCCMFNAGVMAAEDGFLEYKSTGEADVTLTIPDVMRFSIEVDFDKEFTSVDGDIIKETDACIYFTGGSSYSIIATTDNDGFKLNRANDGDDIGFNAYWSTSSGRENGVPLHYGKSLNGLALDAEHTSDCVNGKGKGNSNFSIVIPKDSAQKVRTGSYSTTISVVISPE